MPPPTKPSHPPAAQPARKLLDPWNSSSTGHQRADNRLAGSTSWRVSRTAKLASQFKSGGTGGKRMYDSVGAGSESFGKDGRKENGGWEKGAVGPRETGWQDVGALLAADGGKGQQEDGGGRDVKRRRVSGGDDEPTVKKEVEEVATEFADGGKREKKVFDGLCVFINGSTAPLVGDHRLKQLLAENGARVSIALGRRTVTHVILGTPNGGAGGGGAGGGLAASKIQKEIQRVGGKGVKYVGVEWVLESLKVRKRLPEAQFSNITLAAKGQKSVYGMFSKEKIPTGTSSSEVQDATSKITA
ncbi:MAG: hypothetical protein Q9208_000341 [Pyrenodesmia sp. 3 TL-2023]